MKLVAPLGRGLLLLAALTSVLTILALALPVIAGNPVSPLLDASRRPFTDSVDLDGSWSLLEPPPGGELPPARYNHTAIYDPVGDRIIVFGGYDGSSLYNDAWQLSLSGTPIWTELAPTGAPPSARYGHTAIYDPVRDRMVVMGGYGGGSFYNDTWALSLSGSPAWTALAPTGTPPPSRYWHTAIYDPVRDRMVVFAGRSGPVYNDVWALSLSGTPAWTQLAPTGTLPPGRDSHTAIYDPVRDRMVVFAGRRGLTPLEDMWTLSLAGTLAWTQMNPTGGPTYQQYGHTAIYDPVRDRMVTFAGYSVDSGLDDSWALSLAENPLWTQLAPGGTSTPAGRYFHAAVYDSAHDRMVVFGGNWGLVAANDTWALAWTPMPTPVAFSTIDASFDGRGVVLRWELSVDEPMTGFEVYRRVVPGAEEQALSDVLLDPSLRTLRDDDVEHGRTYEYFVVVVLPGGNRIQSQPVTVETEPLALTLHQNHPNPFNPTTTISFVLPAKLQTRVTIYDVQGRLVRKLLDENMSPGLKDVVWDGRDEVGRPAASGVYFYELRAGKDTATKKMMLLK